VPRRIDEGAPFEQALVAVDEARDVAGVVLAEPAPEHEKVAARDGAGRIELQVDQPVDRREDAAPVGTVSLGAEQLCVDDETPRRALADLELAHHA
jgi:hypothetical protein